MRRYMIPMVVGLGLLVSACGSDGATTASVEPTAAPTTDPAIQQRLDKLEKEAADARRDARKQRQKLRRGKSVV